MTMSESARRLDRPGTTEAAWAAWTLDRLPRLELDQYRSVVVVAPHPDDEVLGCGGLLQFFAQRALPVTVVAVTDGEASHPDSPTVTRTVMAGIRPQERRYALDHLGVAARIQRLGVPDGGVAARTDDVSARLRPLLTPEVLCVAPWERDGHPDHDATAEAAVVACAATGADLLRCLIWTWHWAVPADPRVPWSRARRFALTPMETQRKHSAITAFASQIMPLSDESGDEPILSPGFVAHFHRDYEVFLR